MPLKDCHDLLLRSVCPGQSRLWWLLFVDFCGRLSMPILDVDALKFMHTIASHRHFSPSLVRNQLLIAPLVLRFVGLCRHTDTLERLRASHFSIKWVVVGLTEPTERMVGSLNDRACVLGLASVVRPVAR